MYQHLKSKQVINIIKLNNEISSTIPLEQAERHGKIRVISVLYSYAYKIDGWPADKQKN